MRKLILFLVLFISTLSIELYSETAEPKVIEFSVNYVGKHFVQLILIDTNGDGNHDHIVVYIDNKFISESDFSVAIEPPDHSSPTEFTEDYNKFSEFNKVINVYDFIINSDSGIVYSGFVEMQDTVNNEITKYYLTNNIFARLIPNQQPKINLNSNLKDEFIEYKLITNYLNNIEVHFSQAIKQFAIADILGNIIMNESYDYNFPKFIKIGNNISKGVYFIKGIDSNNNSFFIKIIK